MLLKQANTTSLSFPVSQEPTLRSMTSSTAPGTMTTVVTLPQLLNVLAVFLDSVFDPVLVVFHIVGVTRVVRNE